MNRIAPSLPRPSVIVFGPCGCGKSTIGSLLAQQLSLPFVDADSLHPASNTDKMSRGLALDDADRAPWLEAVCDVMNREPYVIACSALKLKYRDVLRTTTRPVRFVYLHGTSDVLTRRMARRDAAGVHFMTSALLRSQLDTLEMPRIHEAIFQVDINRSPQDIVDLILEHLSRSLAPAV